MLGYDHRHNSEYFAKASAKIYKSYGFKVKIFPRIVPTPFVPSAIQYFEGKVGLGVMITASHNPKQDNGYKVYSGNGAQIGDLDAKEIKRFIDRERGKYFEIVSSENILGDEEDDEMLKEVKKWYTEQLKGFLSKLIGTSDIEREIEHKPFVYTALHGVGADYLDDLFKSIFQDDSSIHHVKFQRSPDPDFSTVSFPNPEEGGDTLKMAMEVADVEGINLIFANDPDADRFCVVERDAGSSGGWRIFNGNEIAVLLADFMSKSLYFGGCDKDKSQEKVAVLGSCVSSRFLKYYCDRRGWLFESTKTGFKNLGNSGKILKSQGYKVMMAFEEAIGFQVGDWNFDKDGLSALMLMYVLVCRSGVNCKLSTLLEKIYEGEAKWPVQCNGYYFCKPASKIKTILNSISCDDESLYKDRGVPMIKSVKSSEGVVQVEFEISRDDVRSTGSTGDSISTESAGSTGSTASGWLMLRSSGTEPKLKYYSELMGTDGCTDNYSNLRETVEMILNVLIDPIGNNLIKTK